MFPTLLSKLSYEVVRVVKFRSESSVRTVRVPLALLLSKDLTPAAKFLWIRLRLDETYRRHRSHRLKQLVKRTCLARSTVYEALRKGQATGWLVPYYDHKERERRWKTACPAPPRGWVHIPVDLIRASHALRPQTILCYGLLQASPGYNSAARTGTFKWTQLRELAGLHLRTLKRAVRTLAEARWIATAQENRRAPIWFRLQHADEALKEEIEKGLERADYRGEAMMRFYLSLIADTKDCVDRARPEFLVNPASGERMEFDRYYPEHRVAFEFNGEQHYAATGRFTKTEVDAQRKRDRLKQWICKQKGIQLIVVKAEDLSLKGMLKKVGDRLPLRALRGFKRTIRFLNECAMRYRAKAAWA